MSNLSILKTEIHQHENLFSLNDLHQASGAESKHKPANFIRLDMTNELVAEIKKEDLHTEPLTVKNGIGTYACEELVLAYAMWISPKFHLIVLRAFLAMHKNQALQQPQQIALPEPPKTYHFEFTERELQQLAWCWFALLKVVEFIGYLAKPLDLLGSKHAGQAYGIISEYGSMLKRHHPLIQRLTAEFKVETFGDMNWNRVLPTIRNFGTTTRRLSAKR